MCILDDCKMQDVNTFVRNSINDLGDDIFFRLLIAIMFIIFNVPLIIFFLSITEREALPTIWLFLIAPIAAFLSCGIVYCIYLVSNYYAKKCIKKRVLDIEDTEDKIKVFRIGKDSYGLYKWSFWSCREVFPPQYEYMTRFASNAIIFKDSGKWGLYNTETKLMVPADYDSILPLSDLELVARKGTDVVYYNQFCERIVK